MPEPQAVVVGPLTAALVVRSRRGLAAAKQRHIPAEW